MTYRSLLVFIDHDLHCAARTQVAIGLAKELDCHLAGVAPTGLVEMPAAPEAAAMLGEFAARAWDALHDRAERAADTFRADCRAAGLASFEAVVDAADKAASLVRHAHCNDLTVLTQADPSATDHRAARDLVEKVVLYSARPTLIVPYAGRLKSVGSRALVAWDDSREAARALADALPLLRRAAQVELVGWDEAGAIDARALRGRFDALRQWLLRQGVAAEFRIERSSAGITDSILSHAADAGADLIVMGAYGHARWAERILGGATRGMLASMTVPVLMSH